MVLGVEVIRGQPETKQPEENLARLKSASANSANESEGLLNTRDLRVVALELAKSVLTKRNIQRVTVEYEARKQAIINNSDLTDGQKKLKLDDLNRQLQAEIARIKQNEGVGVMAMNLWLEQRRIYKALVNGRLAEIAGQDRHIEAVCRLIEEAEMKYSRMQNPPSGRVIRIGSEAFNKSRTFADMIITDNIWNSKVAAKFGASAARSFARVVATGASLGAVGGVVGWFVGAAAGGIGGAVNKYLQLRHEVARGERDIALGLQEEGELGNYTASISLSSLFQKLKDKDLVNFVIDVNKINAALEKGDLALRLDSLDGLECLGVNITDIDPGRVNVLVYLAVVQLLNVKRSEILGQLSGEERAEVASAKIDDFVNERLKAARDRRNAILNKGNLWEIGIAGGIGFGAGAATGLAMDTFGVRGFINEHLTSKVARGAVRVAEISQEWFKNHDIAEYWVNIKEQAATIVNNIIVYYNQGSATSFENTQPPQNNTSSSSVLGSRFYSTSNGTDSTQPQNHTNSGGGGKPLLKSYIPASINPDFDTPNLPDTQNPEFQPRLWTPDLGWMEGRLTLAYNLGLLVRQDDDLKKILDELDKGDQKVRARNVAFLAEAIQRESIRTGQDRTSEVITLFKKDPEGFIKLQQKWIGDRISEGRIKEMFGEFKAALGDTVSTFNESTLGQPSPLLNRPLDTYEIIDNYGGIDYSGQIEANQPPIPEVLRESYRPQTNQNGHTEPTGFVTEFDQSSLNSEQFKKQVEQLYSNRFFLERKLLAANQITLRQNNNIFNFKVDVEYIVEVIKNQNGENTIITTGWSKLNSPESYNEVALLSFNNAEYPVLNTLSEGVNNIGPNIFISGHYGDPRGTFNILTEGRFSEGAILTVQSGGEEYEFEVFKVETKKAGDVADQFFPFNNEGKIQIILVTCTDAGGVGRVLIYAQPTEETLLKLQEELRPQGYEQQPVGDDQPSLENSSDLENEPVSNTTPEVYRLLEEISIINLETYISDDLLLASLKPFFDLYSNNNLELLPGQLENGLREGKIEPDQIIKLHQIIDLAKQRAEKDSLFASNLETINKSQFRSYLRTTYPDLGSLHTVKPEIEELIALKTLVPQVLDCSEIYTEEDFSSIFGGDQSLGFPPLPKPQRIPDTSYVFYSWVDLHQFMADFARLTQDPGYTQDSYDKITNPLINADFGLLEKYIHNLEKMSELVNHSYLGVEQNRNVLTRYVENLKAGLNSNITRWFSLLSRIVSFNS